MTGTIILISEFNEEQLAKHFEVAEDDHVVRAAMRCVLQMKKELGCNKSLRAPRRPINTLQRAIDEIELGYYATRKYVDQFFMGEDFERGALMTAVICKDYTDDLGDRLPYVDAQLAARAQEMYGDSIKIYEMDQEARNTIKFPRESRFLAHVHICEDIRSYIDEIGEYLFEDIRNEVLGEAIPAWKELIDLDSDIGKDLKGQIMAFEEDTLDILKEFEPPRSRKPTLQLCRPDQPKP